MTRRIHIPMLLMLMLAGALPGRTPQSPAAGNSRIYILLKPSVASPAPSKRLLRRGRRIKTPSTAQWEEAVGLLGLRLTVWSRRAES